MTHPCRTLVSCLVASFPLWLNSGIRADVFVDNNNANNSGGSAFTILSSGSSAWQTSNVTPNFYGTDYMFTTTTSAGNTFAEVEFRPSLPSAGQYQVYVWYNTGSNRSTAAPFTVDYSGGSQTINVNQQINGGQWVSIGTFQFLAGTTGRVRLSNQTTGTVVMADGVRFAPVSASPQLTMALAPAAAGTITPVAGTTTRTLNEVVSITATPAGGYNFANWTVSAGSAVASPTSASTTVTMDQTKTVTANFVSTAPPAPEFRCMWVTRFEWPNSNMVTCKATIDQMMTKLQAANFNAVMFQMRGQCDVLYPSPYEPWSPLIAPSMPGPGTSIGWDPMAYAINSAHNHGLEFHAYINIQPCWSMDSGCAYTEPPVGSGHIFHQHCKASDPAHRDWLLHDNSALDVNDNLPNKHVGTTVQCAESNYVWMSPTVPDVHAWVRKQIMYVVSHYDGSDPVNRPAIQAVHWDRIRTPSSSSTSLQYSHDPISVARFNGAEANPDNLDYYAWTREAVNRFTRDIYAQINEIRPEVVVSSSPLGLYSPERYVAYGYPQSACGFQYEYTCIHQDGQNWMANGSMDILDPQIYWAELQWRATNPHYSQVAPDWIANRAGRLMCPGHIGAIGSHPVESIVGEVKTTRSLGGQGDVMFSYSMWDDPSFNGWAGFTDPVNGVYQQPTTIPPMPWKTNPTTGIIIGNITGTDGTTPVVDARITRNGSTYTALSSADGLYSFLLVPPGTYTITCNKAGLGVKTATNVNVVAGQVTRVNINFVPIPTRNITDWFSVRTHNGGPLAIPLDPVSSVGVVEPRSGGIQRIYIEFDGSITLAQANDIMIIGQTTMGDVVPPTIAYTPSAVSVAGNVMTLDFAPGLLPDQSCFQLTIGSLAIAETLAGDNTCMIRSLVGDTTGNGTIGLSDALLCKMRFGPAAFNPAEDVDTSGTIDQSDATLAKSHIGSWQAPLGGPHQVFFCP